MSEALASQPLKAPVAVAFPSVADAAPALGGFAFSPATPPAVAGVYALTLGVDGRLYPLEIGDSDDIAAALAGARAALPPTPGQTVALWLAREAKRQRRHIGRDLVRQYNPPGNVEDRSGPPPAALAELALDRAADAFAPTVEEDGVVSEAEIAAFVEALYAAARADAELTEVFARAVADWPGHEKRIADFWSKTLLGTTRYDGFPYASHASLGLAPVHFTRWLAVFAEVAPHVLPPQAARRAIDKANHMGRCFQAGLFPPPLQSSSS